VEQGVTLATDRLLLREFALQDVEGLLAVLGDPVAMEFYPAALDRQGVEDWVARNMQRYQRDGHGLWAMVLRGSDELIGDCGCIMQEVEGKNEIEVGYHVRRDLWGNGYATEAARTSMEYAFTSLGAARVISMIRPGNKQSRRVAEKNGLTREKIIFWRGFDHCIYTKNKI
jgi:RimJ/RimL family protein N-acetyltransferase